MPQSLQLLLQGVERIQGLVLRQQRIEAPLIGVLERVAIGQQ